MRLSSRRKSPYEEGGYGRGREKIFFSIRILRAVRHIRVCIAPTSPSQAKLGHGFFLLIDTEDRTSSSSFSSISQAWRLQESASGLCGAESSLYVYFPK